MKHPLYHVAAFQLEGECRLRIRFEDGLERLIDFEPVLAGELYGPLQDPAIFRTVRLDPEFRTLVWENGADFDPSILHDWPEHEHAWRAMATKWRDLENAGN